MIQEQIQYRPPLSPLSDAIAALLKKRCSFCYHLLALHAAERAVSRSEKYWTFSGTMALPLVCPSPMGPMPPQELRFRMVMLPIPQISQPKPKEPNENEDEG